MTEEVLSGIADAMAQQWGTIQRQKDAEASGVETLRAPSTSKDAGIRTEDTL